MTHFDRQSLELKSIKLEVKKGFILASAAGDQDYLYYTVVEPGDSPGKKDTRIMMLMKA